MTPVFITAESCTRILLSFLCHLNDFINFAHISLLAGDSLTFYCLLISQLFHHLHNFNCPFAFTTVSFLRCRDWNGPPCSRCKYIKVFCGKLSLSVLLPVIFLMMLSSDEFSFNVFLATTACQENYFRQLSARDLFLVKYCFQVQYQRKVTYYGISNYFLSVVEPDLSISKCSSFSVAIVRQL